MANLCHHLKIYIFFTSLTELRSLILSLEPYRTDTSSAAFASPEVWTKAAALNAWATTQRTKKSHDSWGSSIRPLAEERAVRWGQPTETNIKTQDRKPLQVKIMKAQLKDFFKEIKKLLCSATYTDRFLNQPLFFQHLTTRSVCLGSLGSDQEMTSCPWCECLAASRKTGGIF